jgi:hypothetical protein
MLRELPFQTLRVAEQERLAICKGEDSGLRKEYPQFVVASPYAVVLS